MTIDFDATADHRARATSIRVGTNLRLECANGKQAVDITQDHSLLEVSIPSLFRRSIERRLRCASPRPFRISYNRNAGLGGSARLTLSVICEVVASEPFGMKPIEVAQLLGGELGRLISPGKISICFTLRDETESCPHVLPRDSQATASPSPECALLAPSKTTAYLAAVFAVSTSLVQASASAELTLVSPGRVMSAWASPGNARRRSQLL